MDKITTLTYLINLYYSVCDNWKEYLPLEYSPDEITKYRANIVNTIYIIVHNKMPLGSNTFSLLSMLTNDISGKRYTAEEIIEKLKIYA